MEKQEYKPGSGEFKPGSEPDGFRGIKWGTDISTLPDMKWVGLHPGYVGVALYRRKIKVSFKEFLKAKGPLDVYNIFDRGRLELTIGGATLVGILYGFLKGKFCLVEIYTNGFANFDNLKQAVFEKFGEGYQPNKDAEHYEWYGKNVLMTLEYGRLVWHQVLNIPIDGILVMETRELKEYQKQKAKEGAEKGF